jgi:glycine hydroxymethyltransferase
MDTAMPHIAPASRKGPIWLHPDYFTAALNRIDPMIAAAITDEHVRQRDVIELIASENIVSQAVLEAQGSVLTNKTVVGYPGARFHAGGVHVDRIERLAIERASTLFGCGFANVQPHSGIHANMAVFMALLEQGDTVLSMAPEAGGHISHGAAINLTGRMARAVFYGVRPEDERIDYAQVETLARQHRPKLVVAGGAGCPRAIDFGRLRGIADQVGAFLLVDMAHFSGLVAGGAHPSPFPHAHVVTTTTYKSLRGPRGGMVLTNDPSLAARIDRAVFPGVQGTPLMHVLAGKAVCLGEALRPEFKAYAAAVLANARALSTNLAARGYSVVSGGTDTPIVMLDLRPQNLKGDTAAESLERAGITCNRHGVPSGETDPARSSGLRFGVSACTTRGLDLADFGTIAAWIDEILAALPGSRDILAGIEARVSTEIQLMLRRFPIYPDAAC